MPASKLELVAKPGKTSFSTSRLVNAPAQLVYEAFTRPEYLMQWLGPKAMPMVSCKSDLKVGGKWRFVHRMPGGQDLGFHGGFREIDGPKRLVRTFVYEPMPDMQALETLNLVEKAGKTTINTLTDHKSVEARDGHVNGGAEAGMTEGYARLDELLATLVEGRDMVLTMHLNAPRKNLYRCWTEPKLMQKWFAPLPWTVASVEADVRAGGASNLVMRGPDGQEFPNPGLFLEVVPNERLVMTDAYTSAWQPSAKPFFTAIVTFADEGEGTRYTATARHWTVDDRIAHEKMGFYSGWTTCARQLEALAATL